MKDVTPISKKCRLCKSKKLLHEFELDVDTKDKRANVCKECMSSEVCNHCLEQTLLETAESLTDLMILLTKNGLVCSPRLVSKIQSLAIIAGARIYCDACNERLK